MVGFLFCFTAKSEAHVKPALTKSMQASVIGGIVAGIIFGILMQMMGHIGMSASLILAFVYKKVV